jgi:hypothetical protein
MSLLRTVGLVVALIGLSSAAFAFQEQRTGSTSVPTAEPAKPVELGTSPAEALKPSVGPDVRIPGLGKLGSLPKMDFGLELLYGAAEQKTQDQQPREENRDDLMIRGTVKHNF